MKTMPVAKAITVAIAQLAPTVVRLKSAADASRVLVAGSSALLNVWRLDACRAQQTGTSQGRSSLPEETKSGLACAGRFVAPLMI
jgi:hypothetical protein